MENKEYQETIHLTTVKEEENENMASPPSASLIQKEMEQEEITVETEVPNESDPLISTTTTSDATSSVQVQVTPEEPSTSPKTPSQLDLAIERYKEAIKNWASCEGQEQLLKYHKHCFRQATEGFLTAEEKAAAKIKLDSYFMYILELYEEQRNVPVKDMPLCLEFTNERISMGFFFRVGDTPYITARRTVTYPQNIVTSRDEIMGYIVKSAKQLDVPITKQLAKEQQKLVEILQWSKKYAETPQVTFDHVIIIVPAWFKAEHAITLRQMAHKAEFAKCYLVSDATLAAYTVLGKVSREMPTVVVVSVGILGVDVAMYTILNRTIKMVALEKYEWELNEGDSDMKGCMLACIPIGRGNNIRRAMEAQGDRFQILKTTFTRAADQLDESVAQQKKVIYLVSESDSWVSAYQTFVEQCPDVQIGTTLSEEWEIYAAMRLSNSAGKIRQAIIDHVLPVDPTVEIAVEVSRADTAEN